MKVLRVIMGAVAMVLTVAALLCAFAHFYVFDPEGYEEEIFCEEFYTAALRERDKALDELESVVAVEREVLLGFFDDESCREISRQHVRALLRDVLVGGDNPVVNYEPEGFREYLKAEFEKYDFSETEYGDSATAAEKAYEMTVKRLSSAACFTPQSYVQKALRYVSGVRDTVASLCSFWYLFALGAVLLLVGTAFMDREGVRSGLFLPAAFLWCGCMLVFIPAALVFFGDVASDLELSKNQLYFFISGAINTLKSGVFTVSVVPAAIATALLGYSTYQKSSF